MTKELIITPPQPEEYPEWVKGYVSKVSSNDLLAFLQQQHDQHLSQIADLSEAQLNYRYAPGKWTIKEVLGHIIDTERIMAYRALRFARRDTTELPGFDQDWYVDNAFTQKRGISDIVNEYSAVRRSSIELFRSFDEETLTLAGISNQKRMTVRALGYVIAGHEAHHWQIIHERYLS